MTFDGHFWDQMGELLPTFVVGVVVFAGLAGLRRYRRAQPKTSSEDRLKGQLFSGSMHLAGLVLIILTLPGRGDLLNLLGLLLSAAITLASTTLIGNAMAGLMLRSLHNFHAGDYLHVGEHFGRVSDRGLFHVEIQTVDRDLTTLPNLYLAKNPVKVVSGSGTIVAATVSLGYDVPRTTVEKHLVAAAEKANLTEAFVHVTELGDYSVVYRVGGYLAATRGLVTAGAQLRANMLDCLHEAGIEIVSPMFMNQRVLPLRRPIVPPANRTEEPPESTTTVEDLVFDKADRAAAREVIERELASLKKRAADLEAEIASTDEVRIKAVLSYRLDSARQRVAQITEILTEEASE